MHSTTPLRYMRFFRRRETISMDMNNTEWKMMKDSGKRALRFIGAYLPALILCLPSMDVYFDLMFYRNEKFRAFVEQYSCDNVTTDETFNRQIRRFRYSRDHIKDVIDNKESMLKYKGNME